MARKIDEDKIDRIKKATMQTIVENGIESTTIAMIAKNANVSGGYLYRIYKGKQDLINELYFEKMNSLYKELEFFLALKQPSIEPLIKSFIQNRIVYYINEPIASKFFYQLLHNKNFTITEKLKDRNISLIENIKNIGLKSGEISPEITNYQLNFHLFAYPVDYINLKEKDFFNTKETTLKDVDYLTNNILNILKYK